MATRDQGPVALSAGPFRVHEHYVVEDRGYLTPCFVWTRSGDTSGYGRVWDPTTKRTTSPHRLVYEHDVGPIPEGMQIDHLCRVRRCVNSTHLDVVTQAENMRRGRVARGVDGGRGRRSRRRPLSEPRRMGPPPKLTDEKVAAIAADPRSCRAIAADFDVSAMHVSRIKRGIRSGSALANGV